MTGGHGRHTLPFLAGDGVFLLLVSCATTVAMHMVHELGWGFVLECACGMIVAMLVGTLMAFAAAPLLGSIEAMVPSMVVSMLSPAAVCVFDVFGLDPGMEGAAAVGAAFGTGMFVFVQVYGAHCRAAFQSRAWRQGRPQ